MIEGQVNEVENDENRNDEVELIEREGYFGF